MKVKLNILSCTLLRVVFLLWTISTWFILSKLLPFFNPQIYSEISFACNLQMGMCEKEGWEIDRKSVDVCSTSGFYATLLDAVWENKWGGIKREWHVNVHNQKGAWEFGGKDRIMDGIVPMWNLLKEL